MIDLFSKYREDGETELEFAKRLVAQAKNAAEQIKRLDRENDWDGLSEDLALYLTEGIYLEGVLMPLLMGDMYWILRKSTHRFLTYGLQIADAFRAHAPIQSYWENAGEELENYRAMIKKANLLVAAAKEKPRLTLVPHPQQRKDCTDEPSQ